MKLQLPNDPQVVLKLPNLLTKLPMSVAANIMAKLLEYGTPVKKECLDGVVFYVEETTKERMAICEFVEGRNIKLSSVDYVNPIVTKISPGDAGRK